MRKFAFIFALPAIFAAVGAAQTIEDSSRRTLGYISSGGTVEDSSRRTLGYINSNGSVEDGSRRTLAEAVRYMASGGGADPNKTQLLVDAKLDDREIGQIVAFLTSLTSDEPYTRPALP